MAKRGPGVSLMMIGMLIAGIGCVVAGLAAVGFGIPINEFGLGNTLILAGAVATCSGLIILSLWVAVRELKGTAGRLASRPAFDLKSGASQRAALPRPAGTAGDSMEPRTEQPEPPAAPSAPWDEEIAPDDRFRQEAPLPSVSEQPAKLRRNLMFSSTSRRDRERSQGRPGDTAAAEPLPGSAGGASPPEPSEAAPPSFDDAWPKSERARPADVPPQRRPPRSPPAFSEPAAAARQPASAESQPPVTVLKSGVVDGMAYSLYSDGSIEAQMPEGMMRFASIDELRAHLDQRP